MIRNWKSDKVSAVVEWEQGVRIIIKLIDGHVIKSSKNYNSAGRGGGIKYKFIFFTFQVC